MAARMRAGSAPSATIAATVFGAMPPTAPFQPAWAAPMMPASGSARSTGAQSAVRMPSSRSSRAVTIASASMAMAGSGRSARVTTVVEWIWRKTMSSRMP